MAMRCVYRLLAVVSVAAVLCCSVALGSYSVDFDASDLTLSPRGSVVDVTLLDCNRIGEVGMPNLPARGMAVAIPSNMDATEIRIVNVEYVDLPGTHRIAPCEQPVMVGATPAQIAIAERARAEAVQFPKGIYPGELIRFLGCGWLSGHHLANLMVYPVQYDTVTGALRLYTHIEFEFAMTPGNGGPAIAVRSAAGEAAFASIAKSLVANPMEVKPTTAVWGATKAMPVDAEYLIITDAAYVSNFQPLADWKHAKGYTTVIKTTSSIYSGYTGVDNSAKIRACIQDYFANHGTVYVLLAGDIETVPMRTNMYFMWDGSEEPPVDLYYSDLDGDWNGDNVAGTDTRYPTEAPTFTYGSSYSGSYTDTASDNSVYHRIRTATVGSSQVADLSYISRTTKNAPTSLTFTFNGRAGATGGTLRLDLWNYSIGDWETVKTAATLGTSDVTWAVPVSTDLDRYVNSGTGEVQCRLYYTISGTTLRYLYIDMLKWDASGDCMYGESGDEWLPSDNIDIYPDVFVGRVSFDNSTEANLVVNKILQYEGSPSKPTLATDYELRALLAGGRLDWDGPTDGEVQMEYFANSVIPSRFTKTKLYENNDTLTTTSFVNAINGGRNVIAHANHGWWDGIQLTESYGFGITEAYDLTNSPRFTGFFGSWACLWGGFDSEVNSDEMYAKCLTEQFLLAPNGGGFCAGSSRPGIYFIGDPMDNLSPAVVTEQMTSLFTHNKVRLGEMMADAITTRGPQMLSDNGTRYCFYISNLMGDPETPIWVNTPSAMTVAINPSSIPSGTTTSVTVNVKKSTTNVSGAKVCLWKGTEVYLVGTTNTSGNATFNVTPATTGTIQVTVTYLDDGTTATGALLPYQNTITVTGGGGGSEDVYPTGVTFTYGSTYSGSYTNCAASDNSYHRVRSTTSGTRRADFYYTTTTTKTAPTALTLTFEGHMSSSNTVVLYAYNYTTSSWTQLNSASLGTTDATWGPYTISNPTQYVQSGTGQMRCRLYFTSGYTTKYIYDDLVKWVVTQ